MIFTHILMGSQFEFTGHESVPMSTARLAGNLRANRTGFFSNNEMELVTSWGSAAARGGSQ